jgi:hypothetical protein
MRAKGREFPCRECGTRVAWCESNAGHTYLGQRLDWHGDEFGTERAYWPRHNCVPNPGWQELHAEQEAARIADLVAAGIVEVGVPVRVVRGRKVPIGTTGTVFWMGADAWDKPRIGIHDEAGETFWTATSNVEVMAEERV